MNRSSKKIVRSNGFLKIVFLSGFLLLLSFILQGCSDPTVQEYFDSPERSPSSMAEEFYERYFQCLQDETVTMLNSCLHVQVQRNYFTEDYKKKMQEFADIEEEGNLDPLFCARNVPNGFEIQGEEIQGDTACVKVVLKYDEEDYAIFPVMERVGSSWMIKEINCGD